MDYGLGGERQMGDKGEGKGREIETKWNERDMNEKGKGGKMCTLPYPSN